MDELLSEKEQVEKLRQWWKENGPFVIGGLVLGVGDVAALPEALRALEPDLRVREIADLVGVTERTAMQIVVDLELAVAVLSLADQISELELLELLDRRLRLAGDAGLLGLGLVLGPVLGGLLLGLGGA